MWSFCNQWHRLLGVLVTVGISVGLLGWMWEIFASSEDPMIQAVEVSATLPIHDPSPISDTSRTVYFNNQISGILTVSLYISGTPPLTLTVSPVFNQNGLVTSTQTFSWFVPITYGVAVTDGSYVDVHYTVINTDGITSTAVISYLQDITPPQITITSPQSVLSMTSGNGMILMGTAVDDGAGLDKIVVVVNGVPLTITSLPPIWQGEWLIPLANREVFTITAIATDHLGITGTPATSTFLLDNVPPTSIITAPLQITNHPFTLTWSGTDGNNPLAVNPFIVQYRRNDDPPDTWTAWYTRTALTEALFETADPGYSYTFRVVAVDQAGNTSLWQTATTQVDFYRMYLPAIIKPPLRGSIHISAARSHDITVFTTSVTLQLTVSQQPAEMKLWNGTIQEEPSEGWISFTPHYSWVLPNSEENGVRTVNVRFRTANGNGESEVITADVYYLKNGDFAEGTTGWIVEDHGLGYSVLNGNLRLGSSSYDCLNMPYDVWTEASLILNVPVEPGFTFHFQYTIYTQDQLPDPMITFYDAFEVYLNDTFYLRDGNPDAPISCSNLRILPRQETADLDAFGGQPLLVRFENHSRFDQFYNTYTDIEEVWVSLDADSES